MFGGSTVVGVMELASDSACQVQIQSFDRIFSFNASYTIEHASVGLSKDIAAGNLLVVATVIDSSLSWALEHAYERGEY